LKGSRARVAHSHAFVLLFAVLFKINIVISLVGSSSLPVVDVADDTIDEAIHTRAEVAMSEMTIAFATLSTAYEYHLLIDIKF
jgi:hypothetical protein